MNRLRRRLSTRTPYAAQGGYILLTTLMAMLLCVILVSSMLAVTASTVAIEETGRVRERQARAAESAVELAINEIRNSPNEASEGPPNLKQSCNTGYDATKQLSEQLPKEPGDAACGSGDTAYDAVRDPNINRGAVASTCNPLGNLVQIDNYPVRVFCYNEGLRVNDGQGGPDLPGIPQDDGAIAVRLVGDQVTGDLGTRRATRSPTSHGRGRTRPAGSRSRVPCPAGTPARSPAPRASCCTRAQRR